MENKSLTAVEWLIDWLMDNPITSDGYIEAMMKAKQMEKEQIMNAWLSSDTDSMYEPKQLHEQAEQYYNETYKKDI